MAAINLVVATGRIGREGCGYAMITGQGNGQGAREQGQKCDQLPGARDTREPGTSRSTSPASGAWTKPRSRTPACRPCRCSKRSTTARSRACCSSASTPRSRCPTANFIREALEPLEFFTVIDFFMSETARYADLVLPGSLMEEDEGTTTNVEGA